MQQRPPRQPSDDLAPDPESLSRALLPDVRALIESARESVARSVNRELVLLYFDIGQRIRTDLLGDRRAGYGQQILSTVSKELTAAYGTGFSAPNLTRMTQLVEYFPDRAVVEKLSEVLSWSHFVEVLPLRDALEREFYASMCHACRWSVRGLRREISSALYARTALSKNTEEVVRRELAGLRDADRCTTESCAVW